MVQFSVHSLFCHIWFVLCLLFCHVFTIKTFPLGYGGNTVPDGLLVSPSILDSPPALSHAHSRSRSNYGHNQFNQFPHSANQLFNQWNTYPMFDWSMGNIGRSFMSPEQYYSTAMLAREFLFQPESWSNLYNPFMSSMYMNPFNTLYPSSMMSPFMGSSSWPSQQMNWQPSFGQQSPYSQFMAPMNNHHFEQRMPQQQPQYQMPQYQQPQYQPPQYQPPQYQPPQYQPSYPQQSYPQQSYHQQSYQPPQQQYSSPPPQYRSPPQNSWDGVASAPQSHQAQNQPNIIPTYNPLAPPKIEIGQKLSNSIYANRDSLRYDLSSFSNHEKNNLQLNNNNLPKIAYPQNNPFNPTLNGPSAFNSNQFKLDPSQQALLSDPSFYNRMSQIMPYLNGRFEAELSQENNNKQTSNTNQSLNSDLSSDKSESKPASNNTKSEYGFFKRLDAQRSGSSTSTTTKSPQFMSF